VLVVTAHITVAIARIDEFESLAAELWAASHATEPGLQRYEYARRSSPGTYVASMVFDDYAAFITHQASEHHVRLAGAMREMIEHIEVEYLQPVAGAFGAPDAADAQLTDQEHDLVVPAERVRSYTERYPRPNAAWWRPDGDASC
jgi:quinol monooxygenase YgiN